MSLLAWTTFQTGISFLAVLIFNFLDFQHIILFFLFILHLEQESNLYRLFSQGILLTSLIFAVLTILCHIEILQVYRIFIVQFTNGDSLHFLLFTYKFQLRHLLYHCITTDETSVELRRLYIWCSHQSTKNPSCLPFHHSAILF